MALVKHTFTDFFDLTGGLNTVDSAIRLKKSEARDLQDIDFFPIGGISKRNGYVNFGQYGSGIIVGVYQARYSLAGGTNILFSVNNGALYSVDTSTGTHTGITNGLSITVGANNIWCFDILNNICVLGNGLDNPIQINSTPTATALTSGLPFTSFLFPVQSRGYMWYFRPTVSGSILYDRGYFSSINDPVTVGTNNFVDIGKGQGGDVKGAVDYKTYLYVFKRNGIYQLTFQPTQVNSSGDLFPWTQYPNPVVPGVGTQSHRSIVKFTTPSTHPSPGQELVFFVDQYGVPRIFDGTTTLSFSSKIGYSRDTNILSLSNMDASRSAYAFSINYPAKNKILFFLSKTGSKQDTCWVLDYSTGFAISRYKFAVPMNVGTLVEKSDGTSKPFAADYTGGFYELDRGTTDAGFPINDYYITPDVFSKTPALQNKWFFCELRGINGSTSQGTRLSYYQDASDTPTLSDTKSLANTQTTWGDGPPPMIWGISSWAKQGISTKTSEIGLVSKTLRTKIESVNKLTDSLMLEGWTIASEELGTAQN